MLNTSNLQIFRYAYMYTEHTTQTNEHDEEFEESYRKYLPTV